MKILSAYLLIILLSFAGGLFFPWWIIAIAAFLVAAVIPLRPGIAFTVGFAGLATLWGGLALYIDVQNNHILASRIAAVLPLNGSPVLLILLTALIGALVGGLASLSGSLFRRMVVTRTSSEVQPLHTTS